MTRPTLARRAAAGLVAVVMVSGCGLPLADGVRRTGDVPAEQRLREPISVLPPGPQPGASPEAVVLGFLAAQGSARDDHGIARSFLAPSAREDWRDDVGVTVYDPRSVRAAEPQPDGVGVVVTVSLRVVGEVSADGSARVRPAQESTHRYRLEQDLDGQWQLVDVPDGLMLSPTGRDRSYDAVPVHFLAPLGPSPNGRHLVADLVRVPADGDRAQAVVDRLLAGPSSALGSSAETAVPPGTTLRGPVTTGADGQVTVDLAGPLDLPDQARMDLSAQLVWTLREALPEFTRLRLLVDGQVLAVPGVGQVQQRSDWAGYAPEGPVARPPGLALVAGRLRSLGPTEQDSDLQALAGVTGATDLAVDARRSRIAVLADDGTGPALRTGPLDGPLQDALQAPGLRSPSWGSGDLGVFVLRTGSRPAVLLVTPGVPEPVEVAVEDQPDLDETSLLRVSRDGTRVALVVGEQLLVGRIDVRGEQPRVVALRRLVDEGVRDVAWRTGTTLDVLVADEEPPLLPLLRLSVDGVSAQESGLVGLAEGDPSALASYGEQPLLVETRADGRSTLYSGDAGVGFQLELRDATRPAYPR